MLYPRRLGRSCGFFFGRHDGWETAEMPYKHRLLLHLGAAETSLWNMWGSELRFTLVEHHSVGDLLFPPVEDIAAQVDLCVPEGSTQNIGFLRGVDHGPSDVSCLWLDYSRLLWQAQGDMYFIQRQVQAMKRLCGRYLIL
jgi:hypothetical protein